ncbi:MAG: insulinase family protein [Candidatus Aegiribacteria sp.]|nr:insulinase family protein [Candidatus Aegiribacteria sp.]
MNGILLPDSLRIEKLENGLTVILQELRYSPVAAVCLAYRAGPLWETPETRGLSHFCEHMMFKGSKKFGPGTYWQIVQRNGGLANAYTSRDITVYYSVVPKAGLNDILELEADRMQNCSMTAEDVTSETAVILEEELLTDRDDPAGILDSLLYSEAFSSHPYGRPITGSPDDIRSFSQEKLQKFYRNFYNPSNAVISVVGDIDCETVFERIGELFGKNAGHSVERPPVTVDSLPANQIRTNIEHPSVLPRVSIGFRVPEGNHADSAPLSLISVYLASGRSSRFEELLVKPSLVLDISVSTNTLIMPGLYAVRAVLPENGSASKVEDIIFRELKRIGQEGIERSVLEILKNRREAWSIISNADPLGRARRFGAGYAKFNDPYYYWNSIKACNTVDENEIRSAASRYFRKSLSTVSVLKPSVTGSASPPAATISSSETDLLPPTGQEPSEIEIPDRFLKAPDISVSDNTKDIMLDNGIRVLLKRDASFPIVSMGFSCSMGSNREPAGLAGLSEITAEAMLYGTHDEDSIKFNARLECLGTSVDFSSTSDFAGGIITSLSKDVSEVLSVISDMFIRPAFRQVDIDAVRTDAVSSLEEWIKSPVGAAMNSFSRQSTYPPERAAVPTRESLEALTREDIIDFHRRGCRPSGTTIVAVGSFQEDSLLKTIRKYFSNWKDPAYSPLEIDKVSNQRDSSEMHICLEGREQIAVLIGSPAPPRLHRDSYAISILNGILGEGIGSRLGRNIRETGLSYHVSSLYIPLTDRGRILALLLTSPSAFPVAFQKLKRELKDLTKRAVSRNELRLEKASYIGRQELGLMKYSNITQILLTYASMKLPLDHDRYSLLKISELTEKDIRQSAKRWLGSGITYISVAGGLNTIP